MEVLDGLAAGRTEAMRKADTNKPMGRKYDKEFGDILKRERLDKLNSGTRGQLFTILDHRIQIAHWYVQLSPDDRQRINHPSSILRHWGKTAEGHDALAQGKRQRQKKRQINYAELRKENERLNARIAEVEQERDSAKEERDQLRREVSREFDELRSMPLVNGSLNPTQFRFIQACLHPDGIQGDEEKKRRYTEAFSLFGALNDVVVQPEPMRPKGNKKGARRWR
jgi:hypothetical protein